MRKNAVSHKVYNKIYDYLNERHGKIITAAGMAHAIGEERIFGATMAKLAREGWIYKAKLEGYWVVANDEEFRAFNA